jgi:mRNA interferase MazF
VLTRSSALRFLNQVTVAPITSTIREIPSEIVLDENDGMKRRCAVNLDHLITIPRARLGRRVAVIGSARLEEVARAIAFALEFDELLLEL